MMKISKFFEFVYLAAAVFFLYEAVNIWDTERNKAYLFLLFVFIAVFMFFFRRHFRNKYQNRNK